MVYAIEVHLRITVGDQLICSVKPTIKKKKQEQRVDFTLKLRL